MPHCQEACHDHTHFLDAARRGSISSAGQKSRREQPREATTRQTLILAALALSLPARAQEVPDGATLFRRQCGTCHSLVAGEMRQGPNLAGVYGRKAGTAPGFKYSDGFADADWTWDEAHLDPYLTNPQSVIKGGVMGYRQAKPEIRQAIIAYLKEQH